MKLANWIPPHVTLVICGITLVAVAVGVYPVYAALDHHPNALVAWLGQNAGHAVSAVSGALASVGTILTTLGHSAGPFVERVFKKPVAKDKLTDVLLPPRPALLPSAAPPTVQGDTVNLTPETLLGDIEIANLILTDVVSFAQGNQVSGEVTVAGKEYTTSIIRLPNGPAAPYVTINGSLLSILMLVMTDAAAFMAGAPIQVAVKLGNTWSGLTIAVKAA